MSKLVRDIMQIGVPICGRETPLAEIARILVRDRADALIVMDEFGACGVVSQTDLVKAYARADDLAVAEDIMTEQIVEVAPDVPLAAAGNVMIEAHVHQLFLMHGSPGPSRPSAVLTEQALVRELAGQPR